MEKGDCFRCSLASVLGLHKDKVPDFVSYDENSTWDSMISDNRKWLADRNLDLMAFWFDGSWKLENLLKWFSDYNPGRIAILQGAVDDYPHAVAIKDGKIIVNTCPLIPLSSHNNYWFFYIVTPLRLR